MSSAPLDSVRANIGAALPTEYPSLVYIEELKPCNQVLPADALLAGYSLYEFSLPGGRADPWALVAADGTVVRVWTQMPSLADVFEACRSRSKD